MLRIRNHTRHCRGQRLGHPPLQPQKHDRKDLHPRHHVSLDFLLHLFPLPPDSLQNNQGVPPCKCNETQLRLRLNRGVRRFSGQSHGLSNEERLSGPQKEADVLHKLPPDRGVLRGRDDFYVDTGFYKPVE